jgi:orotidine-5'-phosphate decarboxylase
MLSEDRLFLAVDSINLEKAHAVARDFRTCTHTVMVGQTLLTAYGLPAVRSFSELGMTHAVVDARLSGHQKDLWSAINAVAGVRCIRAVTVMPCCGPRVLAVAAKVAKDAVALGYRNEPLHLLASLTPSAVDLDTLREMGVQCRSRKDYIAKNICWCYSAGLDGIVTDPKDIAVAKRAVREMRRECKRPFFVLSRAQRGARNYAVSLTEEEESVPGVTEILETGVHHCLYDMNMLDPQGAEWTSDLLYKELRPFKSRRKTRG